MPRIHAGKNRITWCELVKPLTESYRACWHLLAESAKLAIQLKRRAEADDYAAPG